MPPSPLLEHASAARRLLAATILAVLALVGAACSDSPERDASGTETAEATTAGPADATTEQTAEDSAEATTQPTTEGSAEATTEPTANSGAEAELRLNHLQVLGSHNSYHLLPPQPLFDALAAASPDLAASREYEHVPLTEQLERYAIRQLELDVYADPDGGLYAAPAANQLVGLGPLDDPAMLEPGFKVLHTLDIDYESTCVTLVLCLAEIDTWSRAHPDHVPLVVMLEFKSDSVPDAAAAEGVEIPVELDWTVAPPPTSALLDELDAEIRSVFSPERLIEPDDVRGDAGTLEAAILDTGWPTLGDSRGMVMFTMVNGGAVRELYTDGHPNLEGRAIFTNATPGQPDAAFLLVDDPSDPQLDALAEAGYLIRTRTDEPTGEARANDTARRDTAISGGAHFLSTDYYKPSDRFDSGYVVELPGGGAARCNPVTAPPNCTDAQVGE